MLTNRLETVKNLVENSNTVFDVGTDHGYVPISLINEKRAKKVIAADINKGPLDNAEKNIRLAGLTNEIELRLGSGMVPMKDGEADTVVIAGMGGILISDIIKESYDKALKVKRFILQPMYSQDFLRNYLINNGFKITNEYLSRENEKVYNIIVATPGKEEKDYSNNAFVVFGHPDNHIKNEVFKYYIEKRKNHLTNVYQSLKMAKTDKEEEINNTKNLLSALEEYYACTL